MKMKSMILVVDDENKSRLWLVEILKRVVPGANVHSVDHPFRAIEMLGKANFDLLFIDYGMPQMNGVELMKQIEGMKHLPAIVLVSGYKEFDFAQKGIEMGALDYIVKPVDDKQIAKVIEKYKSKQLARPASDSDIIILSTSNGDCPVKKDFICLVEMKERNMLRICLQDGTQLHAKSSLQKIHTNLPENYIYITRQCVVNRNNIRRINPKAGEIVLFTGSEEAVYPCSRNQMKALIRWRDAHR